MSAERPQDPTPEPRRRTAAIIGALIVLTVIVVVALLARSNPGDVGDPEPTDSAAAPTEAGSSTPPQTEATSESATATPAPEATTEPAASQPSATDIEEFQQTYGPGDQSATGDVNADGLTDVVVVSRRDETTRIDVGFWDGTAFVHDADEGGPAATIDALTLEDFNGEAGAEIVTEQSVGEAGRSLSVWGGEGARLVRQSGEGGCWDGFHTYGISGATIERGRITATCDGSPLPPEGWTRDVYEWDGAWIYTESITPEDAS